MIHLTTSQPGSGAGPGKLLGVTWSYVVENLIPGVLSGPWQLHLDGGAVQPALWGTVLALLIAVPALGWLLRVGGPTARWAIATMAGCVLVQLAMVLVARAGFGSIIGLDPRYSADLVLARQLMRAERISSKTLDALHLAIALRKRAAVVSFDLQMRRGCEALGLSVAP